MEEDKAAAYYNELSRKGEGAARYKQGLGFSSSSSAPEPKRHPSAATDSASASFFSNFVRASSPGRAAEIQKQAQLESIQNKLKKKPPPPPPPKLSSLGGDRDGDRGHWRSSRSRSRSRSGSRDRYSDRRRSSSRERDRSPRKHHHSHERRRGDEDEERSRSRRRRRSRSRSGSEERGKGRRSGHADKQEDCSSRRSIESRSSPPSPRSRRADRSRRVLNGEDSKKKKDRIAVTDYSQLIEGYSQMTPAERVKAKMKLQLSKTAEKDMAKGTTKDWERFDFNQEAPLDDEEIEVAEDDESLVKDIGRSFRYSAVEAKREEEIKAAHDQAMFGALTVSHMLPEKEIIKEADEKDDKTCINKTLISEKALAMQGSWRDRMRRPQHGPGN